MNHNLFEINDYWSYLRSIDWTDPWLIGLVLFHIATTLLIIFSRNKLNFQFIIFLFLITSVYFSANLNEYAARNWQRFSREQYFDSNGLFIGTVFSIPILLNCLVLIGTWLQSSCTILLELKTVKQLSRKEINKEE